MYTTITIAHTGLANLTNSAFQAGLIGTARGVMVGRPIEVQCPHRHAGSRSSDPGTCLSPSRVSEQALELSPNDILQHLAVQRQVRDDLLQPRILVLELLQLLHLRRQHARVFFLPVEIGRLTNSRLPADLRHRHTFVALFQNERLLCVRKLRCLHRLPFLSQPGKCTGKL